MRHSWETMTSVSAGHIILTPTQPVGSGRPQRESNSGPPHQESCALPTELPSPPGQFAKEEESMAVLNLFWTFFAIKTGDGFNTFDDHLLEMFMWQSVPAVASLFQ